MNKQTYLLHALSPLHAGVGQAAELIDMPIARMKGTGIPFVPGSSIKGVLRDAAKDQNWKAGEEKTVFGPDRENDEAKDNAGSLICTDARLLALPVRSFKGPFAYVTSPLLLTLAARDFDNAPAAPSVLPNHIIAGPAITEGATVYLEDLDLARKDPSGTTHDPWMKLLSKPFEPPGVFSTRFAVVHDDVMTFLWETATQLDRRVSIDHKTGTARDGALWLEESLPPETLLIGMLLADTPRWKGAAFTTPQAVLDKARTLATRTLQFGGKSTVGRGRCRMVLLP